MRALLLASISLFASCAGQVPDDLRAGDNLATDDDDGDAADPNTRARVCAGGATTPGIDVSKWEGTINWTKVKAAGIGFAFARVSDGANTRDATFATNWAGAKSVGIVRGAYQFFRPAQSATAQADLLIAALGGSYTPGDLPPVIDVEDTGGLAAATVAARVRTWVDRVHAQLGVTPIVYTGKYFWRDEVGGPSSFAGNPLWIAQYTSLCPDLPAPWSRWTFWQNSETGTVNGISGAVDLDKFNGSLADLQAFANGVAPTAPSPIEIGWVRNANGSYDFTVDASADTAKAELRVEDYLIGAPALTAGHGTLHYTFNVATPNRAIEVRGLSSAGALVSLGNGIVDSQAGSAIFVRQTDELEYEIGWERPNTNARTLEVTADGTLLTDLDSGTTRSARGAVRYRFTTLGTRALAITERTASGTVVSTATRTLVVR
jgi:lysozyme